MFKICKFPVTNILFNCLRTHKLIDNSHPSQYGTCKFSVADILFKRFRTNESMDDPYLLEKKKQLPRLLLQKKVPLKPTIK